MIVCFLFAYMIYFFPPHSSHSHVILFVHLEVGASCSHQQLLESRQHRVGAPSLSLCLSPMRKFGSKSVTAADKTELFF